jgi:hypothetical protein
MWQNFYENIEKFVDKESDARQFNQNFNQPNEKALTDFSDIFNQAQSEGPITRAKAKLIKYKDAAQLALMLLKVKLTLLTHYVIPVTIVDDAKVKKLI